MTTKFENIQGLRGVAVLLVVLFHLTGVERKCWQGDYLLPNFLSFGNAGVDLFFVISGFVMVVVTRNQFQNISGATHFIYHRITRIFPLYWFYSVFFLLIHWFFPAAVASLPQESGYLWKSFLLWPQINPPLLMNGWTLIHEIYFYIMMTLFLLITERNFPKLLGGWGLLVITGSILFCFNHQWLSPLIALIIHPLTLEFIAGCGIALLTYQGIRGYPGIIILISIILFFIGAPFCNQLNPNPLQALMDGWRRIALFGIPAAGLVYTAVVYDYQKKILPKLLRLIGNYSYSIYLSHIFLLSACGRFFAKLPWQNALTHILYMIMALILVYFGGKYSYLYLEKPILQLSRKWFEALAQKSYA